MLQLSYKLNIKIVTNCDKDIDPESRLTGRKIVRLMAFLRAVLRAVLSAIMGPFFM